MARRESAPLASLSARLADPKGLWNKSGTNRNHTRNKKAKDGGRNARETKRTNQEPRTLPAEAEENVAKNDEEEHGKTPRGIGSRFPDLLRPIGRAALARRGCGLVWFRADLRLHDHAALRAATKACRSVACVFCFDPREYEASESSGCDRTGPYRARFLLQCVQDLRQTMRKRGGELHVRIGKPEEVLLEMAKSVGAKRVYAHGEATMEDMRVEGAVRKALGNAGIKLETHWASTLYHIDDLPFHLQSMPSTYASFREQVYRVPVRAPIPEPERMPRVPRNLEPGEVPTLNQLGIRGQARAGSSGVGAVGDGLVGGESEAMKRLGLFLHELVAGPSGLESRRIRKGNNFSSNISPWLAMGCLSPRQMYANIKSRGEAEAKGNAQARQALDWVVFELLWRDFFRFITKKYGQRKENGSPVFAAANV